MNKLREFISRYNIASRYVALYDDCTELKYYYKGQLDVLEYIIRISALDLDVTVEFRPCKIDKFSYINAELFIY